MIRIEMDARGVMKGLKELTGKVKDLRPAFKRGTEKAREVEDKWFDSEGRGTWANLAEITQISRGKEGKYHGYYKESIGLWKGEGHAHKILHWTHRLKHSLTRKGSKGSIAKREGIMAFRYGTEYDYKGIPTAFILDKGTGKMPPRKLLDVRGLTVAYKDAVSANLRVRRLGMS